MLVENRDPSLACLYLCRLFLTQNFSEISFWLIFIFVIKLEILRTSMSIKRFLQTSFRSHNKKNQNFDLHVFRSIRINIFFALFCTTVSYLWLLLNKLFLYPFLTIFVYLLVCRFFALLLNHSLSNFMVLPTIFL